MPVATLPLLLNIFVAGMFVASFLMIAYLNPEFRRVRWMALSYAIGMLTPLAEALLPLSVNPVPFKIVSYGSFLLGLVLIGPALSVFYNRTPFWSLAVVILVTGAVLRWMIWDGPRDELWYEFCYQVPFSLAMIFAAFVVLSHGRDLPLDRLLAGVFFAIALHFLVKPLAAAQFGSGATAAAYINSRYALFSQAFTGMVLIGVGLVLLINVLQTVISHNRSEARTDALTGLPNRRALFEEFQRVRHLAPTASLSLAIFDIDRFKEINDRQGHSAGDEVLRQVGRCLAQRKPSNGIAARIGGEEFVVLFPGQDAETAMLSSETLRLAVRHLEPLGTRVTLSAGVTVVVPQEDLADAVRRADRGLYKAKLAGRDQVAME